MNLDSLRTTAERLRGLSNIRGAEWICRSRSRFAFAARNRVDDRLSGLDGVEPAAVEETNSRLSKKRTRHSRVVDGLIRRFDVTMRLPDRLRKTQKLGDRLIPETPVGWISARQIAEIRKNDGPNESAREWSKMLSAPGRTPMVATTWRR